MIAPIQNKEPPIRFYECELPVKTVSEANLQEYWAQAKTRHSSQKLAIIAEFNDKMIPLPCIIKLSRISPKLLDSDNLQMAFKWIRDQLAECIIRNNEPNQPHKGTGRYDDDPRIKWEYSQENGKPQRIRIEIFTIEG